MSTSTPTPTPERDIPSAYASFKHTTALLLLIGAPILIALPPRKLDLYTFSLAGMFILSANELTVERTGRGIVAEVGYRYRLDYSRKGKEMVTSEGLGGFVSGGNGNGNGEGRKGGSLLEEKVREGEDWRVRRLREEKEKLEEGKSYEDIIVDQIWDVWNQEGKGKKEEEKGEKGEKGGK